MTDSKKSGPLSGVKQAWGDPKARKGMIMVGTMAAIVVVVTYSLSGREAKKPANLPANVALAPPTSSGVRGDQLSGTSEEYKALVRKNDEQRLAASSSTPGAMVLPKIAGLSDPNAKPPAPPAMSSDVVKADAGTPIPNQQVQAQGAAQRGATPEDRARTSPAYKEVFAMLKDQVEVAMKPEQSWNAVRAPSAATQGGQVAGQSQVTMVPGQVVADQSGIVRGSGVLSQQVSASPLISMGSALFATLDTAVNSDYSGPVRATIHQGKFAGAQLMGTKTLEYDALVIKFTHISLGNGEPALPVNAYAISIADAKNFGSSGLVGQMDRHVFTRYVIPAAIAFVSGYGQAAAQAGSQITTNAGGYTQSTSALNSRDRWITAAGVAVQPLVQDMQRQAARPITVSLDSNTEIGILFATDVMPSKVAQGGGYAQQVAPTAGVNGFGVQAPQASPEMSPAMQQQMLMQQQMQQQQMLQQQQMQMQQQSQMYGRQSGGRAGYSYVQPYGQGAVLGQ